MSRASAPVSDRRAERSSIDVTIPSVAGLAPGDALDKMLDEGEGFLVARGAVGLDTVNAALRLLNLEIVRRGLTPEDITRGSQSTFFPHLRWEREVQELRAPVDALVTPRNGEEWADPQLLLRFPDEAQHWPATPHVDGPPPWADGRTYRAIAGVALSPSTAADGCLAVWPRSHAGEGGKMIRVELEPGDVVVMHPKLAHSSTLNTGGRVRYAVYFRLLHRAPAP